MKPERVDQIYEELASLVVELDRDPVGRGPGYIQELISQTRGFLNKTSVYHQEVMREHYVLERELVGLESVYEISSDELLANDNRVTRLPNIDDRKAMINLILREERVKVLDLKRAIRELGFVEKVIKSRQKELDNTMAAIRMQKSLMDSETRAGSYYGDESGSSRGKVGSGSGGAGIKTQDDISEEELRRLLGDDDVVIAPAAPAAHDSESVLDDLPQPVGASPVGEPKVESGEPAEDPDISRFLEGDDLSEILNSI